jgi:hypothetical protein
MTVFLRRSRACFMKTAGMSDVRDQSVNFGTGADAQETTRGSPTARDSSSKEASQQSRRPRHPPIGSTPPKNGRRHPVTIQEDAPPHAGLVVSRQDRVNSCRTKTWIIGIMTRKKPSFMICALGDPTGGKTVPCPVERHNAHCSCRPPVLPSFL